MDESLPQGYIFSCSSRLSMKFQLLIETKMLENKEIYCIQTLVCCIYHAYKCSNSCWHFNTYELDESCLFEHEKSFITSGPGNVLKFYNALHL